MIHFPTERAFAETTAKAAPWWIAIGVTGVTVAIVSGKAPLLASLALVAIGSDADLGRRLREALAGEGDRTQPSDPAIVAGLVRRVHAAMYGVLIFFAWASLLHLQSSNPDSWAAARWWLAADVAAAAVISLGYGRLARRHG